MLDILPDIEAVLKAKGHTVPRPKYDGKPSAEESTAEEEDGDEHEEEQEEVTDEKPQPSGRLDRFKMKPNHEATSDEDDG